MTDTEALKKKISDAGLKQGYIAEQLGLSSYGFANKLNNVTEFKATEIQILCEILHVTSLKEKEAIFFNRKVDK